MTICNGVGRCMGIVIAYDRRESRKQEVLEGLLVLFYRKKRLL